MGWIILIVVVLILIWIVSVYNGLISSRQKLKMLGVKLMYNYKEDLI